MIQTDDREHPTKVVKQYGRTVRYFVIKDTLTEDEVTEKAVTDFKPINAEEVPFQ